MHTLEGASLFGTKELRDMFIENVPQVYYICRLLLPNENSAIDACLSTFKRAFSSIDKLEEGIDSSAWIKTAAAITCCAELRRSDLEVFIRIDEDNPRYAFPHFPSGTTLNMSETAEIVEDCLLSLPSGKRAAVLLYYFVGLSISQIAKIMRVQPTISKELLLEGRRKIEDLQWHLKDIGVDTCRMTLLPILELRSSCEIIPEDVEFSAVYTPPSEPEAEEKPKKRRKLRPSAVVFIVLLVAALISTAAAVIPKLITPKTQYYPAVTVASKYQTLPASTDFYKIVYKKNLASSVVTEFLLDSINHYDEHGELIRQVFYKYEAGELLSERTVSEFFDETLTYSWNKSGTTVTVKNNEGDVVEKTKYNAEGYPIEENFFDSDKPLTYTWKYERDSKKQISKASFNSTYEGNYIYKYDNEGRCYYTKSTISGETEIEEVEYDSKGMVTKKTITDSDGEKTIYTCTYDYKAKTFKGECSDGSSYNGKLTVFRPKLSAK